MCQSLAILHDAMLKDTLLKFFKLEGLIDHLTGYVETRIQLMKYEIREEVAEAIANAIVYFVLGLAAFIFLLLASVTAALFIGEAIGYSWGFMIVSGFYLVVALVIFLMRKDIEKVVEARVKKSLARKKKTSSNGNGRSS